jgi:antitoxin HicB
MDSPAEILRKPYARIVVPDTDGRFVAEIEEFPGCIADGDTAQEALANLEEVAESWLLTVIAKDLPIPEPIQEPEFSGKLVLRIGRTLHQQAARAAKRDGISLNAYISTALAIYIGTSEPPARQNPATLVNVTNVSAHFSGPTAVVWTQAGMPQVAAGSSEWSTHKLVSSGASATNPWGKEILNG